ncbi:pseudouridine synthase [Kribbella koreensis]|uniref:Pseudouridine synthase n=2 Tax=Kribbella TaxID=182639 RepID=A0ABP6XD29_9ACTN
MTDEQDQGDGVSESGESGIRLQKALAQAGIASRRGSEILIEQRRVEVDGQVVTEFGTRVDPAVSVIRVDGVRIPPITAHVYLVLNKPRGVVTTMSDPQGRPCVADYVHDRPERLFHIGRLDTDTEGLLLLTNHGEFAHRLAHPSYEVSKTYVAEVEGNVKPQVLRRLTDGLTLDDGFAQADTVREMTSVKGRTLIQMTLHEGRNRIVRRMFDAIGHPVKRLTRTAIGPVRRGNLHTGELRELDAKELGQLLDLVDL